MTPVRPSQAVAPDFAGQAVLMADGYWYAIPPSSPLEVNLPALLATLAHRPRYGGLVPALGSLPPGGDWTAGQHTLALVRWGREAGEPAGFLRELFVHDLHEAYIGDTPGPVKWAHAPLRAACKELEAQCDEQIRLACGLPVTPERALADRTREYDLLAVAVEADALGFREDALQRCLQIHAGGPLNERLSPGSVYDPPYRAGDGKRPPLYLDAVRDRIFVPVCGLTRDETPWRIAGYGWHGSNTASELLREAVELGILPAGPESRGRTLED